MGRRTYDLGQEHWGDDEVFPFPAFVLTHEHREPVTRGGTTYTFVDAADEAMRLAQATAGEQRVNLMGIDVTRQYLAAGMVDELRIHLVPVVLGAGTPLFAPGSTVELETVEWTVIEGVSHTRFRVVRH